MKTTNLKENKESSPNPKTKKCSSCKTYKNPTEFYVKGKSLESSCKECKKKKRRKNYLFQKKSDELSRLAEASLVIIESQKQKLKRQHKILDQILEKYEKDDHIKKVA